MTHSDQGPILRVDCPRCHSYYSPHRPYSRQLVGPNNDPGPPLHRLFVPRKLFRILALPPMLGPNFDGPHYIDGSTPKGKGGLLMGRRRSHHLRLCHHDISEAVVLLGSVPNTPTTLEWPHAAQAEPQYDNPKVQEHDSCVTWMADDTRPLSSIETNYDYRKGVPSSELWLWFI